MLVFSGLETEDFTCRSPGELEVVRNDILKPLARDGLPLYPYAHDDGSTGKLRNLASLTDATLTGGSTLPGAAKRRNDFQHAGSLVPGNCLFRAAPAWSNLAYASNSDNTSFEGGTAGDWTPSNASHAVSTVNPWHGSRCLVFSATGNNAAESLSLTSFTANAQYTAEIMVRANNADAVGESVALQLIGDASGTTSGTAVTLSHDWQLASVTKTFAGDTARTARLLCAGSEAGDEIAMDAFIIVSGSTIPMFTEAENTTCYATFPTPISPGEDASGLLFIWLPQSLGTTNKVFLDLLDSAGIQLEWFNSRLVFSCHDGTAGKAKYYTGSITAGFHAIAWSRRDTGTDIELNLAVDGTSATADGTPYGSGNDQFNYPSGICTDGTYIWVSDTNNHRVVKRSASDLSYVSKAGSYGAGNENFQYAKGICTDGTYLWIADTYNHRVVKRSASDLSYISKIGSSGSGNDQFAYPQGICTDGTYIWVSDTNNHRIVKRQASDLSYVSKIGSYGSGNDQFYSPIGICTDGTYLWVCDTYNHRIVKRLADDLSYVSKIGSSGSGNDQFAYPQGICTDGTYIWVSDTNNHRIVKRQASDLSYVSKIGSYGSGNDQFSQPRGICTDGTYLWVCDTLNHRIVKRLASNLSYVSESPIATSFETSLPATLTIPDSGNCLILGPFIYRGAAWDSATCQRMSRLKAPPPRNLAVRAP